MTRDLWLGSAFIAIGVVMVATAALFLLSTPPMDRETRREVRRARRQGRHRRRTVDAIRRRKRQTVI